MDWLSGPPTPRRLLGPEIALPSGRPIAAFFGARALEFLLHPAFGCAFGERVRPIPLVVIDREIERVLPGAAFEAQVRDRGERGDPWIVVNAEFKRRH